MSEERDETYLGDGLYASFDGLHIWLRAPRDDGNDHRVALDHSVYQSLVDYAQQCFVDQPRSQPGHWRHETTGVLRPAIMRYLNHDMLESSHIAAIRAYLRQWIGSPSWDDDVDELRADVDGLTSREAIDAWIGRAVEAGCDPL